MKQRVFFLVICMCSSFLECSQPVEDLLFQNEQIMQPYIVHVLDRDFWVYPQNFGSQTFPDTTFYAENLPIKQNQTFLEVGSGTGIISVMMAIKSGSKVVAIDINPYAVENTKANALLHNVDDQLEAFVGDVFSPIDTSNKFDLIFFNVPALDTQKQNLSPLEQAIYDPGYQILERYLREAPSYLANEGLLFVGYSPLYGDYPNFEKIAKSLGFSLNIVVQDRPAPSTIFELVQVIIPKETNANEPSWISD